MLRVEETPLQVAARGALQEQEVGGGCHALGGGGGDDGGGGGGVGSGGKGEVGYG